MGASANFQRGNDALNGFGHGMGVLGFQRLTLLDEHSVDTGDGQPMLHRLQVDPDGDSLREFDMEAGALGLRQTLEHGVLQLDQPFGKPARFGDDRVPVAVPFRIDVVREAADGAAAEFGTFAGPVGTGRQHVRCGVVLGLGDVLGLEGGVAVEGEDGFDGGHGFDSFGLGQARGARGSLAKAVRTQRGRCSAYWRRSLRAASMSSP